MHRLICLLPALILSLTTFPSTHADVLPFPTKLQWGNIVRKEASVELHVTSLPDNGIIRMPRLNNPWKRIYLKSDSKKKALEFRPEIAEWLITYPRHARTPGVIVVETTGPPRLLIQPFVTQPNREGIYNLPAYHAVTHGELLRFEPQPHKNTVGYWANEEDWCEWQLNVEEPGEYEVHILQGCGKGHGGSEVSINIGKSKLAFIVEDTGHFQNFKPRNLGRIEIMKPGRQSLKVKPISKAKGAVMDVRAIRLLPVGNG